MAVRSIQTTFSAGELSEATLARFDMPFYAKGLRKALNVFINSTGNLVRRDGTKFIDVTDHKRLETFVWNGQQKYCLTFGNSAFKVYYNDVLVFTGEITLTDKQLQEMTVTQAGDVMLIFHNDFITKRLARLADNNWAVTDAVYTNVPFYAYGKVTITKPTTNLAMSSQNGNTKLTFGAAVSVAVGDRIYLNKGGALEIYKVDSTTIAWGTWKVSPPEITTVASQEWELEKGYEPIFSATRGYPACGCFGKGRLFVGGIRSFPNAVLGSVIEDFFNFSLGSGKDDEGLLRTSPTFSPIKYMTFTNTLEIFSNDSECFLDFNSQNALSPSNFILSQSSSHGVSCLPVNLDGNTVFIEKSGRILRNFLYDDIKRSYNAPNLSILSQHLIKKVKRIATRSSYDENPNNLGYLLNSDGTITIVNLLNEQEFIAFSRCETKGKYIDIASAENDVYCLCERVINGENVKTLERFDSRYILDCSIKSPVYETRKTEFSGLGVFEGQDMYVIGDDFFNAGIHKVEGGKINGVVGLDGKLFDYFSIDSGFKQAEVGFDFLSEAETAGIEYTKPSGLPSIGQEKRAVYIQAMVIDTAEIMAKFLGRDYKLGYFKLSVDKLDENVNIETGYKTIYVSGISQTLNLTLTQEFPGKFNIAGLIVGVD